MNVHTLGITIQNLNKSFGEKQVLKDLSLTLPFGKTTALMAPSGSGKTTFIRILMGLEQADSGTITGLDGIRCSAVFQEDRLCENLSSIANIHLVTPKTSKDLIIDALGQIGLSGCEHQAVRELSGGMKRRVAILRALMSDYDILFLDEPFKGLDASTKELVIGDTRRRCQGKTVLLITHNQEEALAMGAEMILSL